MKHRPQHQYPPSHTTPSHKAKPARKPFNPRSTTNYQTQNLSSPTLNSTPSNPKSIKTPETTQTNWPQAIYRPPKPQPRTNNQTQTTPGTTENTRINHLEYRKTHPRHLKQKVKTTTIAAHQRPSNHTATNPRQKISKHEIQKTPELRKATTATNHPKLQNPTQQSTKRTKPETARNQTTTQIATNV